MNNQFRIWDGEMMHEGDTAPFCVRPDGNVYEEKHMQHAGRSQPTKYYKKRSDYIVLWYVGIEDHEGRKIFEGDIIGFEHDSPLVVTWVSHRYEFRALQPEGRNVIGLPLAFQVDDKGQAVVIGNKYQHPHLLNKENPHPAETE